MGALDNLKEGAVAIGFIAIFAGAIAIALGAFKNTLTTGTAEYNVTTFGLTGVQNSTSYLGTVGVLLGVGALISVVVASFWYMKQS